MGRPRKPTKLITGHFTAAEMLRKEQEEEAIAGASDQLQKPPDWLNSDLAKSEWNRLVHELESLKIIGNLDLNNLAAYCNAYAIYREATEELKSQPLIVEKQTKFGTQLVQNPLINVQKVYSEEMRRYADLCCLTLNSRLKAGTAKVDKQEENLEKRFGAI